MRIIAGQFGGRRLRVPPGIIRPAMDQMRESVFASLGDLDGLAFLDLFAGSGSVGLEALSRGASRAVFVESDRKKIAGLKANIADLLGNAGESARVVQRPVERFIAQSDPAGAPFDLVFADPPFPFKKRAELLEKLASSALLAPEAVILIHYPAEDPLPQSVPGLQLLREKRYGRSMVRFLALLS